MDGKTHLKDLHVTARKRQMKLDSQLTTTPPIRLMVLLTFQLCAVVRVHNFTLYMVIMNLRENANQGGGAALAHYITRSCLMAGTDGRRVGFGAAFIRNLNSRVIHLPPALVLFRLVAAEDSRCCCLSCC